MSTFSELQQELMMLWNSRVKDIEGLRETGRKFQATRPISYVVDNSQRNYKALMLDMKKQMRMMRKQMSVLQREMNDVLKQMNAASGKDSDQSVQLSK